ncbi:recombinase family protein [Chelatococcus daeguensis]|uniref:recombinase family protein n=1 Tax=Chelatococcus daeguensis TaxID=444444 RepID=UPI00090372C3|nr:recombinase family protein [Chelatococcus daeguensis]
MIFGYARVSKAEGQDTAAQVVVLKAAGAETILEDAASGGRFDRPALQRLLGRKPINGSGFPDGSNCDSSSFSGALRWAATI